MDIRKKILTILTFLLLVFKLTTSTTLALTIPSKSNNIDNLNFVGTWYMQTIVTESSCPHIVIGTTTESTLKIKPTTKNNDKNTVLKLLWEGENWNKSEGTLKLLNEKEAITERITETKTNDDSFWKAILIDHLNITEQNTIHSETVVTQYKNGIKVGKYKTFSILTKSSL